MEPGFCLRPSSGPRAARSQHLWQVQVRTARSPPATAANGWGRPALLCSCGAASSPAAAGSARPLGGGAIAGAYKHGSAPVPCIRCAPVANPAWANTLLAPVPERVLPRPLLTWRPAGVPARGRGAVLAPRLACPPVPSPPMVYPSCLTCGRPCQRRRAVRSWGCGSTWARRRRPTR